MDNWIKIEDRKPEINCFVAVRTVTYEMVVMSFHRKPDGGDRHFWWWGFGKWNNADNRVTHWVQLPELPHA